MPDQAFSSTADPPAAGQEGRPGLAAAALRVPALRHIRLALPGVLHGTEGDPHTLHRPAAPAQERVLHVVPEVLRHVVVDERVQAAVEAGQAQRGDVEAVTVVHHAVFEERVMHHQHDVAGNEADEEGHQDGHDQHHGSVTVLGRRAVVHTVPQNPQQQDVGHHDDDARDQEHHQTHEDEVKVREPDGRERVVGVMYDVDVMAGGDVGVFELGGVVVQVQRGGGAPDEGPDGDANAHGHFVVLPLLGQGVSHDPVPLNAEAGDEQHRAVHVPVEEAHQNFAQRLSIGPVVALEVVGNLQGRPNDEEEIG